MCDNCSKDIDFVRELAEKLVEIAKKDIQVCDDDDSLMLCGIVMDSAYAILKGVDNFLLKKQSNTPRSRDSVQSIIITK